MTAACLRYAVLWLCLWLATAEQTTPTFKLHGKLDINARHNLNPLPRKFSHITAAQPHVPHNEATVVVSRAHHHHHQKMSVPVLVLNMIADLCPHGMLPLAYGMAKGGPTGVIPAVLIILLFGTMSAFTMISLGTLSEGIPEPSFTRLWQRYYGSKGAILPELSILTLCLGCCLFYSAFIGDIFSAVSGAIQLPAVLQPRHVILPLLSALLLLPLILLEDLSSLKYTSLLSVLGVGFTALFVRQRAIDGSYSSEGRFGSWLKPGHIIPASPIDIPMWTVSKDTMILATMACVSYLAHYNGIRYFNELAAPDTKNYTRAVSLVFGLSSIVFVAMMIYGYATFGAATLPLLLNNYHRTLDIPATVARIAVGLSIVFGYPLMFSGVKSALFALFPEAMQNKTTRNAVFVSLLATLTAIASKCTEHDVSMVLGIVGSVLGSTAAFVIPGIMNYGYLQETSYMRSPLSQKVKLSLNVALVATGGIFGVLGAMSTVH